MIRIFESDVPLTIDRVRELPTSSISSTWDGHPIEPGLEWSLSRDGVALWFRAVVPGTPDFDASHRVGQFVEGLWHRDVVELFLREKEDHYLEFNISPAGAWWSCLFQGYRKRAIQPPRPETLCIKSIIQPASWEVLFAVRTSELSIPVTEETKVHVSAILHQPQQQFLSSQPVPDQEPDYHLADCFAPIEMVSGSVGA